MQRPLYPTIQDHFAHCNTHLFSETSLLLKDGNKHFDGVRDPMPLPKCLYLLLPHNWAIRKPPPYTIIYGALLYHPHTMWPPLSP